MARKNAYERMDDLQAQVAYTLTRQRIWDQPETQDATQYAGQNHLFNPRNTVWGERERDPDAEAGETRGDWT